MSAAATLPRGARRLVGAVAASGAAVVAAQAWDVVDWRGADVVAFAALVGAAALTERFQIELTYRNEKITYSMSDALWTAALLLARPSVLVLSVVTGVLLGQGLQSWASVKVGFNVGQFAVGITVAVVLFDLLDAAPVTEPMTWAAAAAAMAGFHAINAVAVGGIITLTEGEPFRRVVLAPTSMLHWIGNVAIGILGALVWTAEPLGVPLLLVPLGATYIAYRGWLATVSERDQLREIAYAADEISVGRDLGRRVPDDEQPGAVGVLAATLNRMLDRVDEAFRRERLFISETSHELRTPITICRGHLEVLAPAPSPEELSETVAIVTDELDRMARLVTDLTTLARMEDSESLHLEDVDLERLVTDVAAKAAPMLDGHLHVRAAVGGDTLRADPQRLVQALINLLTNAADHTPAGTSIELAARSEPSSWRFEVTDSGRGLPPGAEHTVFLPFHAGKDSVGTGLGLTIVSGIARAHGGHAGVVNRPGGGATFWIELPR